MDSRNLTLSRRLMPAVGRVAGVAVVLDWAVGLAVGPDATRSAAGAGMDFALAMALAAWPGHSNTPAAASARPAARVLLAEDNPINREVAASLLHDMGCCVVTAGDGAQAFAAVQTDRFDLALMDCQMPVMDGFEATRRIRAWEATRPEPSRLPIVALTANALAGDREACLAAGMDDYLAKPIASARLAEVLARWVGDPVGPAPVDERPADGGATGGARAAEAFDPSVLDSLPMVADGSQPGYAGEVLAMYADGLDAALAEIDAAVSAGDDRVLQRRMHSLKSSSAQVGAVELAALAALLEGELRAGRPASAAWTDELRGARQRLVDWWSAHPRRMPAS